MTRSGRAKAFLERFRELCEEYEVTPVFHEMGGGCQLYMHFDREQMREWERAEEVPLPT